MKNYAALTVFLTSVFITGCSYPHYYYSPIAQNVPLFTDRIAFAGHVAGSMGDMNKCLELQSGFSFPHHVALMANFMMGGNDRSTESYDDFSKLRYFETALGYYTSFNELGVFEIYGGYGTGIQHHAFAFSEYDNWFSWNVVSDGKADLSFSKIFIQPDIGIKSGWLEGAFSCRITMSDFNEITLINSVYRINEINILRQYSPFWFLEPAITFRAGSKSVKGQIQFVFAGILDTPVLKFEKIRLNFGVHFNLAKMPPETD